ncbi:hypothetical protein [Ornithinibacillus xuwenensis]|uniref:Prepilin-type N-terminal cleavage/methylation domain-containing protein n=1 Tax=Ornithinibacillus xuwenensis TaxID=3144668 RepID=A0ABU9XFS2_9BACI
MLNSNGFTVTESLISLSILIIITTAWIPLYSLISQEKQIHSDKRIITDQLHDELQLVLWDNNTLLPKVSEKTIGATPVKLSFKLTKESLIKGCAQWNNIAQRSEEVCLYGYQN